jgi:urease accessory protein
MVFRNVPVAGEVYRPGTLPAAATSYRADSVTLGWEERMKTRARRRTENGLEFVTALERGTVLRQGDALVLESVPLVVTIHERPEEVLVVSPRTVEEWALWAYHIGNSHQPLMIDDDTLVCPDIPGVDQMLGYHGIPFTRERRPFTPVSQAPSHHGGG